VYRTEQRRLSLKLRVLGVLLLLASGAFADVIVNLDYEFSGGADPAGTPPWVTLTFEDIAGGVRLTIANVGLTGTEFNSEVSWNLDPAKNAASFVPTSTTGGTHTVGTVSRGTDAFKADGDGFFDYKLDLPTGPPSARFVAGETFVIEWSGLTSADFNFPSVNGPVDKNGFIAAAHIQSIGPNGESGWIGNGPTVPEPSSIMLLGTVLLGSVAILRRKFRKV
jgi:hypothetical protein